MSVEILEQGVSGTGTRAVMICNTSMVAFGPVWPSHDHAEAFLEWLKAGAPDNPGRTPYPYPKPKPRDGPGWPTPGQLERRALDPRYYDQEGLVQLKLRWEYTGTDSDLEPIRDVNTGSLILWWKDGEEAHA